MNVKGFILEDDQGREFVMVCEKPYLQTGRTFLLRGWQRRRLIPLHYSERELRRIIGGVLVTLDDLFKSLPRFSDSVAPPLLRRIRFQDTTVEKVTDLVKGK